MEIFVFPGVYVVRREFRKQRTFSPQGDWLSAKMPSMNESSLKASA